MLAVIVTAAAFATACRGDSGAGVLVITASDQLRFEPSTLTVKVGEPVKIRLDNSKGVTLHDLSIDQMPTSKVNVGESSEHAGHAPPIVVGTPSGSQLHLAAAAGKTASIEFVPSEAGRYVFYCSVSGHRQGGMEGVIVVEAA